MASSRRRKERQQQKQAKRRPDSPAFTRAARHGNPIHVQPIPSSEGWRLPLAAGDVVFKSTTTTVKNVSDVELAELRLLRGLLTQNGTTVVLAAESPAEAAVQRRRRRPRTSQPAGRGLVPAAARISAERAVALLQDAGVDARAEEHGVVAVRHRSGLKVVRQRGGYVVRSAHAGAATLGPAETTLHNPTSRERAIAAEHGADSTGSALTARRGSSLERLLLRERHAPPASDGDHPIKASDPADALRRICAGAAAALQLAGDDILHSGVLVAALDRGRQEVTVLGLPTRLPLPLDGQPDDEQRFAQTLLAQVEPMIREAAALAQALNESGVAARLVRGGLEIADKVVPLRPGRPVAASVAAHLPTVFADLCRRRLQPLELDCRAAGNGAVEIRVAATTVARVAAHRATVSRTAISGDFLVDGEHWQALRTRLQTEIARAATSERQQAMNRLGRSAAVALPAAIVALLDPELRLACEEASADLRERRSAAYSHVVSVAADGCTASFRPVEPHPRPRVHFTVDRREASVSGWLDLVGAGILLPARFDDAPADSAAATAYAVALLAFAALTVAPEFHGREPSGHRLTAGRGRRRPPAVGVQRIPHRGRRRYRPSGGFVPTGRTATAHWVVGHIRRLPDGQEASAERAAAASDVGIVLREGETWVSPHVRGWGAHEQLTFHWQMPVVLVQLLRLLSR